MPMSSRLLRPRAAATTAFSPLSISGVAGWWDASKASSLFDATTGGSQVANGGAVARWEDLSGNARHLTQSTANNRPLRRVSQVNGLDAVEFDGTNDSVALSTPIAMSGGATLVICLRRSGANNGGGLHSFYGTASPNVHPFSDGNYYDGFASTVRFSFPLAFRSDTHMYSIIAGSDWRAYMNGAQVHQTSYTAANQAGSPTPETQSFGQGRNFFINAWMCEMMFYSRGITVSELSALYAYIKAKWGTA